MEQQRRGRPKGAKNKRTKQIAAAARKTARVIEEAVPGAFSGDAHALLMAVYKDPAHEWALRVDAAKAAIRYEKPALAAIEHAGKDGGAIEMGVSLSDADRAKAMALLIAKKGNG